MLYAHQKAIIDEQPLKCGLFLGTGGGKTRIALNLARGNTLVIAPKTQVEDRNWERELEELKIPLTLTVISKETFRRDWESVPHYDTVILEEAHTLLGVSPSMGWRKKARTVKSSQLFGAVDSYVQKHKPERLYIVTATVVRNPLCVWGAAKLLGKSWDFQKFRDVYYIQLPMPGRDVWRPRTDEKTKLRLAKTVQSLGYTGRLEDWFDVPAQTDKVIYTDLSAAQKDRIARVRMEHPDPIVFLGKRHQIENGVLSGDEYRAPEFFSHEKLEKIIDLSLEFPKLVVFAKYLAQIEQIKQALEKQGKKVYVLTGATKDRGEVIQKANAAKDCVFIAQSQISAGYELPDFPCVVYASMSWSVVDLEQSRGRVLRANALKKNLYVYLVVKDSVDEHVYKTILTKKDFNDAVFIREHPELL